MTDNNLEISAIMEHGEKEKTADKKNNENNNDDTSDTAKTGSITGLSSAPDIKNAEDERISDSAINNMSLLSTSFFGVDSKYVKDLQASFQSITDLADEMKKSQYPVVSAVSTIVV